MRTEAAVKKTARINSAVKKTVIYILLALVCVFALLPLYVTLISSFKTYQESYEAFTWWPKQFVTESYKLIFGNIIDISILNAFLNTVIINVPMVAVGLTASTMAAFMFAKMNFIGKNVMFSLLLLTMFLPGIVTLMPSYIIYSYIGWVDTFLPLMVPGMFGGAACVFFMRQYIRGIPTDLIEAADIDGMSKPVMFFKIILPLSVPALISQGILWFVGGYNDYLAPLIYLQSTENYTIQIALKFFSSQMSDNIPAIMAGAVVTMAPLIIIYTVSQRFFISGIAVSGLKA